VNGWHRIVIEPELQRRVDPHFQWARATGFRYFFRPDTQRRFPVVIELNGITARQFARGQWRAPADWAV